MANTQTVYADWCGPCKAIAPTYESLSTKHSKPNKVTFTKVNVDQQQGIARQYGVSAYVLHPSRMKASSLTIQNANVPHLPLRLSDRDYKRGDPPAHLLHRKGRQARRAVDWQCLFHCRPHTRQRPDSRVKRVPALQHAELHRRGDSILRPVLHNPVQPGCLPGGGGLAVQYPQATASTHGLRGEECAGAGCWRGISVREESRDHSRHLWWKLRGGCSGSQVEDMS
jgi:thiol-disulfide isomerase/thioredoxin